MEKGVLILVLLAALPAVLANDNPVGIDVNASSVRLYNDFHSYYFNTSSMIQFTNNFEEYWSKNNLCLGWEGASWQYYCKDSINMSWSYDTDNLTYAWIQGLKNLSKGGKDARFNITYWLGVDDEFMTVWVGLENTGVSDIDNRLKFAWITDSIRIGADVEDDVVQAWLNDSWMVERYLNESLNISRDYVYGNKFILQDLSTLQKIEMWWQYNNYTVSVVSDPAQYNAPVEVRLNYDNGIPVGQSRKTAFYWVDDINCYTMFGDKYEPDFPEGGFPDGSKFSDGNTTWGMTCHIDPDSTACSMQSGPSRCPTGDYTRCRIYRRLGDGGWVGVATSANGNNCEDDDGVVNIGHYADYTPAKMAFRSDLRHDTLTDYRCVLEDVTFVGVGCAIQTPGQATTQINDYWYNNHTPQASYVVFNATPTGENDIHCNYSFSDIDSDAENLSISPNYVWFKNGAEQPQLANLSNISASNFSACDSWSCGVRVYDDVFITGREDFNLSQSYSLFCEVLGNALGFKFFGSLWGVCEWD